MMSNPCRICTHPKRLEIDREIVRGVRLTSVAMSYGVPYSSLQTHATQHVTRQLSQAWDKAERIRSIDLLGKIDTIIDRAESIFQRNYDAGKDQTALKALAEQRNTIDLLAKISYYLHQAKEQELELERIRTGQTTIELSEDWGEKIKILTEAELDLLYRLQQKVDLQDPNIRVIT